MKKLAIVGLVCVLGAMASAGTITVTSPVSGDFLGRTNQLRFTITGSRAQARVDVAVTSLSDPNFSINRFRRFDPDVDGQIEGSIDLNFNDTTPAGNYRIVVTVTEPSNPYNSVTITPVTIDVRTPKFRDFSPANGAFVRNDVPIRVVFDEPNIEEWRVQVNGQDIPNNTGTTDTLSVTWRTQDIINDGSQSISVNVEDRAGNTNNRTISVTLDRVAPSINILSPTNRTYRPGSRIPVAIDFVDQFQNAVPVTNIDVFITDMSGNILSRIPRRSSRFSGSTLQWTGRINNTRGLPRDFKILARAVDRAGNPATSQEVIVRLR